MIPRRALVPLLLATTLAGCASMKPGLGFDDVSHTVADRTGLRIHWDNGSPEDHQARAAVDDLLAQELTAGAAVQVALLNNRSLQATYEDLNLAQADLVQAGLLRNPIFSGEVRFGLNTAGTGVVLDLSQQFLSILYIPLRKARAQAEFEAAKLRVASAVLDLAGQTRAEFYDLQAQQQLVELLRTTVDATSASYDLAQRLRAAGNIPALDLHNERALFEQSKLDLAATESTLAQQRERLNDLMGVWGTRTGWRSAARLPDMPADEAPAPDAERRAIELSLDLALARREIEVASREAGLAQPLAYLSDADIGIASERELDGEWSLGPSFAFPIPLFDQGQGAAGSAHAHLRQAAERYTAAAIHVRSRTRAAYAALASARDRARYYEHTILPLRQQILDETQLQYNAMQVSPFQLLQAKRDLVAAGAEFISAQRDYWIARAEFDQILSGFTATPRSSPAGRLASPSPARWAATAHGD